MADWTAPRKAASKDDLKAERWEPSKAEKMEPLTVESWAGKWVVNWVGPRAAVKAVRKELQKAEWTGLQ
jgi:hypothetical protein